MQTHRVLSVLIGAIVIVLASPSGHPASGFFDRVMRDAGGSTVEAIKAMVPQAAATGATEKFCGAGGDVWCRNLATSVVGSFSTEFVDRLTREDLQKASEAREQSIRTGERQVWENPATGASGSVESAPAEPRPPAPVAVTVAQNVELTAPILDAVGEPYRVRAASAAVLSGPGPSYATVMELAQGSQINAIARVQQTNWYLVGEGPVGKGYLDGSLIEPAPIAPAPASPAPARATAAAPEQVKAAPPPQATPTAAAAEQPAAEGNTRQVEVAMAAECYTTTQRVSLADGTTEEAVVTSCRTPDGWMQV